MKRSAVGTKALVCRLTQPTVVPSDPVTYRRVLGVALPTRRQFAPPATPALTRAVATGPTLRPSTWAATLSFESSRQRPTGVRRRALRSSPRSGQRTVPAPLSTGFDKRRGDTSTTLAGRSADEQQRPLDLQEAQRRPDRQDPQAGGREDIAIHGSLAASLVEQLGAVRPLIHNSRPRRGVSSLSV